MSLAPTLREGVRRTYSAIADDPAGTHPFPVGRAYATSLGYDEVVLDREGYSAVVKVLSRLSHREPLEFVNALRSEVLAVCSELGIPIPPVGAGVEDGGSPETVGPDGIQTQAWWLK